MSKAISRNVVCVHGLWGYGVSMYLMKRRLEKEYDMRVWLFDYPSVRGTLDENVTALAEFIHELDVDDMHLIGHSLGGVVALRLLATHADALPGRLVCIGSPLTGSRAADFLSSKDWAERIVGNTLPVGVVEAAANEWGSHVCEQRDVGVIAGTAPLGLGQLLAKFDEPNDGTVAVSETRLQGARDHICVSINHYGMLVSPSVADQVAAFLLRGEFLREDDD